MTLLMLKELPRYECLLKASGQYPSLDPTAAEAFLHLLRTGDDVFAAESEFLAEHHVTQGRFTVLMLLNRCKDNPCTPAALADESLVTRSTMSGLIDTLEKDGMVIRKPIENDRRTIRVHLTSQGEAFLKKMLPKYFRCVSSMMQPLTQTERKQLVRLLQKIQQGLAKPLQSKVCAA